MQEFHRRVTAVTAVPHVEETSSALLAGATVVPLADSGDFTDAGGHVRILGEVYTYSDMDEGDESGVPSITLDSGLLSDVPAETMVEEWNDAKSEVVTDWVATVTDEVDGSSNTAVLSHTVIAMIATGIPVVGESVTVRVDDEGSWWVVEVHGATPGYDPGFIRTGGLGADTVVWAGTEDGRRAQLDGIDGALECFNDANEQTVNLDGEQNYIEGTLATAADGGRVEVGSGVAGLSPVEEVRLYSGAADEVEPAKIRATAGNLVQLISPTWDGGSGGVAEISVEARTASTPSSVGILADTVTIDAGNGLTIPSDAAVLGVLDATMGAGSVGAGTFKESVEDTAIAAPFSTSLGHTERAADGTQVFTTGLTATVLFATSTVAERGGISYDSGTGVFTVTQPGRYHVDAVVSLDANATGRRLVQIRRNGTVRKQFNAAAPSAGNSGVSVAGVFDCVASDTIDVRATQDSGANRTAQTATNITITNLGA